MGIGTFAFIGIKDFVISDRLTRKKEGNIKHSVNLNLSDETAQDYLRGGYEYHKLLTLNGDRDTKLTITTASMSTELFKVLTNNDVQTKTKPEMFVETLESEDGTFTIENIPSKGGMLNVFALDDFGKEIKPALELGDPTSVKTAYSISEKVITCNSEVTKIVVYYESDVLVETIEAKNNMSKNYMGSGILVVKEIETGNIYKAWIDCPNMTIKPSFSAQAKNESGAPDVVTLDIDLLKDNLKGYPYSIDFQAFS